MGWVLRQKLGTAAPPIAIHVINFQWNPNPEPQVTGYNLYIGRQSGTYPMHIDMGNHTTGSYAVAVNSGAYYFALTAYAPGLESGFSSELNYGV